MSIKRGFTRSEVLGVIAILAAIGGLALFNFQSARVKARDEQRKANARAIVNALEQYHKDVGNFPLSSNDGKLMACKGVGGDLPALSAQAGQAGVIPCEWGVDKLVNPSDASAAAYLNPIPLDPKQGQGFSSFYLSNGSTFQIFASLESRNDPERSTVIERWGLVCGRVVCNHGITLSRAPVKELLKVTESEELKP
ncbi:MAG: type II secretion system protein [Patescibacteria group bacterium]